MSASFITKLRAPKFWDRPSLLGTLLSPLGLIYAGIASYKQSKTTAEKVVAPVIAVGNVTLGGAGKTPVTIALAAILQRMGYAPHLLSRGYGGEELRAPVRVDPDLHSALMVGDEPLLLARAAPTWVFPERVASARAAIAQGANILVLDDGMQHHAIAKDLSLLVIDTSYGIGNGEVFPAGPLREPIDFALDRTSAIIALGSDPLRVQLSQVKPIFRAALVPTPEWAQFKGKPVVAFAGLARPEKFFAMCEKAGMAVVSRFSFPDHHPYSRVDANHMIEHAQMMNATLVTTEKDMVKLHPDDRANIIALGVNVMWQDEPALEEFLRERLSNNE